MFYFGVDYYPEHWPEEHWSDDAPLMAEADINVVRLAEVAWSYLEPHPGHSDLDWRWMRCPARPFCPRQKA
jgi:beta-galactosidase